MESSETIVQGGTTYRIPTINTGVINAFDCLSEGKALVQDQYWLLVGICVVAYLIAGMAPLYILYGPMLCGVSYCFLRLKQGEPLEFSHLFKSFDYFMPGFVVGLVEMLPALIVGVPLYLVVVAGNMYWAMQNPTASGEMFGYFYVGFIFAWSLVIIVSIVTHVLFAFSFPLVVEWKLPAVLALKLSARAVRANLGGIIGLFVLTSLVLMAGALICGIGVYLAMPMSHAAWTVAYRRIFPPYPHHLDIPPEPPVWQDWQPETAS